MASNRTHRIGNVEVKAYITHYLFGEVSYTPLYAVDITIFEPFKEDGRPAFRDRSRIPFKRSRYTEKESCAGCRHWAFREAREWVNWQKKKLVEQDA